MKNLIFVVGILLAVLSHASAQPAVTGQPQSQTNLGGTTALLTLPSISDLDAGNFPAPGAPTGT